MIEGALGIAASPSGDVGGWFFDADPPFTVRFRDGNPDGQDGREPL